MVLSAKNVSKSFNKRVIIENINISTKTNNYICLIGKSGSGKTTILNILSGMMQPDNGEVFIDNKNIYKDFNESKRTKLRSKCIGYLNYGNCLIESLNVYENILYPLKFQKKDIKKENIDKILKKLEIENIKNSYPSQISAGEYRRVCFARILMLNTDILILDEPTSNLDKHSADVIINIINELKINKKIIISTHDSNLIGGKIIEVD